MNKCNLIELIPTGKDHAIHANILARKAGVTMRELRHQLELLRRTGEVILSSVNGYYLPSDLSEVTAYRKKEEQRAKSIFRSLRSARQLEKRLSEKT